MKRSVLRASENTEQSKCSGRLSAVVDLGVNARRNDTGDYERVIDSIVSGYDLSSDLGRRKAFNTCSKYADQKLSKSIDYNYFISLAAKRCGCNPVINSVLRLAASDGSEKVILRYTKNGGPCLSANRNGLAYLSNAFAVLASSKLPGEHFHLRHGEFPMVGRSFPLTVYLHDEAWFEEQEKIATSSTDTPEEISQRDIDPNSVRALIITDHLPTQMMLTSERLYLVRRVERLLDQKTWKKCIRENSDRMYLFEFLNDDGQNTSLGLDLDDKGVLFLTEDNLKQVLP